MRDRNEGHGFRHVWGGLGNTQLANEHTDTQRQRQHTAPTTLPWHPFVPAPWPHTPVTATLSPLYRPHTLASHFGLKHTELWCWCALAVAHRGMGPRERPVGLCVRKGCEIAPLVGIVYQQAVEPLRTHFSCGHVLMSVEVRATPCHGEHRQAQLGVHAALVHHS